MLSGYFINGQCFPDASSALNSYSSNYPMQQNGVEYAVTSQAISGVYLTATMNSQPLNQASVTSVYMWAPMTQCDPAISTTPYFDGMQMGWGVVAAMAVAASIIQIKHSFFR